MWKPIFTISVTLSLSFSKILFRILFYLSKTNTLFNHIYIVIVISTHPTVRGTYPTNKNSNEKTWTLSDSFPLKSSTQNIVLSTFCHFVFKYFYHPISFVLEWEKRTKTMMRMRDNGDEKATRCLFYPKNYIKSDLSSGTIYSWKIEWKSRIKVKYKKKYIFFAMNLSRKLLKIQLK